MVSRQAQRRLQQEYKTVGANPPPYIVAKPNDENILEWHYIITGPPNTPYENGQYHGMLRFPADYPFKPPSISIITPNGRFACNTRLCLSMSDYHPDTWNPAWSVLTILTGLLSFMTGDEQTTGSIASSDPVKRKLAQDSKKWNLTENSRFNEIFPDLKTQNAKDIAAAEEKQRKELKEKEKAQSDNLVTVEVGTLDAEDRARLLDQEKPIERGLLMTVLGMVVAAVLAVYMYF